MPITKDNDVNHTGDFTVLSGKFKVLDSTDPTKVLAFDLSGLSAGATTDLAIPDLDDTAVFLTATQTLTNKTLTAPEITAAATDSSVGTVGTPASGTLSATFERMGNFFKINFTLTAAQIPVTDGAGSGSHGSLKLMDIAEGSVLYLGCRQDYTAYSPDGTGVPDDTVFEIGVGTTAISAAADGSLGSTEDDIGGDVNQTLVSGTTTGTAHTASNTIFDGTTTAADINLNFSGTAATVDGNGTLDVTGTICIVGVFLGDD